MRGAWVLLGLLACGASTGGDKTPAGTDDPDVVVSDSDVSDDEAAPDPDPTDVSDATDVTDPTDLTDPLPDAVPVDVPADGYCEHMAETYCGFYLRCGRHVAEDLASCQAQFLETCNAVYEPHYVALADAGQLALSPEGVAGCINHLRAVACDDQPEDLDGPCGEMWVGQQEVGSACGLGIESMVCDDASTCVLGLDLCGTCQSVVPAGAPCFDGDRCPHDHTCMDDAGTPEEIDVCTPRGRPGDRCSDNRPCALGLSCDRRVCTARPVVGLGQPCGAEASCAYGSACVGSVCSLQVDLGASCDATRPCRSGTCASGVCEALRDGGEACSSPWQCLSGSCDVVCAELPGECFLAP
jgi:hypothetical protein